MYAVIEAAGRQYRVEPGETVKMEKIAGEPGTPVVFDKVLMVTTDAGAQIGKPYVAGIALGAEGQGGAATSEFMVRADRFAMVMPGYGEYIPFAIGDFGPEFSGLTSWSNVTGAGKPEDGATVGAEFGKISPDKSPLQRLHLLRQRGAWKRADRWQPVEHKLDRLGREWLVA